MSSSNSSERSTYWLTRSIFLRGLGIIYAVAFLVLTQQFDGLLSSRGLLPIDLYLDGLFQKFNGQSQIYFLKPTIFWISADDTVLLASAYTGLLVAMLVAAGYANSIMLFFLWVLYLSFVNAGQIFYGYGWESILLEVGFLAIFLTPLLRWKPYLRDNPPPEIVIWLLRWVLFRIMFGAGLIKLRASDPCWREFTCLLYHYETQPIPNPLSWYFHQMPEWFHTAGVFVNHVVEIIVPWMFFGPRKVRHLGGLLTIIFQLTLIFSGNLSWLNWLTIVVCIACFDDTFLRRFSLSKTKMLLESLILQPIVGARKYVLYTLAGLILFLSIQPTLNLISPNQLMNAAFDPFHLVNTYGAFGTVGRVRHEVVLQGTTDKELTADTDWFEIEFKCKPGNIQRRPCIISPYHLRLDWQIWFAAMQSFQHNPWLIHLVAKLLAGDDVVKPLLQESEKLKKQPYFIRGELYKYSFSEPGHAGASWWNRERVAVYFPPLSLGNSELQNYLKSRRWLNRLSQATRSSASN